VQTAMAVVATKPVKLPARHAVQTNTVWVGASQPQLCRVCSAMFSQRVAKFAMAAVPAVQVCMGYHTPPKE
jgi:hypothetical protein